MVTSYPNYLAIRGQFIIVGKQPDGDSVRFAADDISLYNELYRNFRIKPNRNDRSVQLRFEAIDAPEVHYGTAEQPLGKEARDALLTHMGFKGVQFAPNGMTVSSATVSKVPGAILTQAAETNGRPISYVLVGDAAANFVDGAWVPVTQETLKTSENYWLMAEGYVYYTSYTSQWRSHRNLFRETAQSARAARRGVWAADMTEEFILEDQSSLGRGGQLILPKLFRRCTDYLRAVDKNGFAGNLQEWLLANSSGSRNENDEVLIESSGVVAPLSSLIEQRNRRIAFQADLLDITFVEK